jgi:hypothetical protein
MIMLRITLGLIAAIGIMNGGAIAKRKDQADQLYVASKWMRTTKQLPIQINDNITEEWQMPLRSVVSAWNQSEVISSSIVPGFSDTMQCPGISGTIQICSAQYGKTDWVAIARIVVSGEHIAYGIAKLNDSYFDNTPYSDDSWRQWTICRQLGHIYGLTLRRNENAEQGLESCMDSALMPTDDGAANTSPVDLDNLTALYSKTDRIANSVGDSFRDAAGGLNEPAVLEKQSAWGQAVHYDNEGRADVFEKIITRSRKMMTLVIWSLDRKKGAAK